jgi:hypothetical protein
MVPQTAFGNGDEATGRCLVVPWYNGTETMGLVVAGLFEKT